MSQLVAMFDEYFLIYWHVCEMEKYQSTRSKEKSTDRW